MIKKITLLILFFILNANNWDINEIEYLIYTNTSLLSSATNLSILHESDVGINDRLKTRIILNDTLNTSINQYIMNNNFSNLKYLAILGDESIITPITYNNIPCDACLSSTNSSPNPQLITGRILASNNQEANVIIDNTRSYMLSPYPGMWKSELLLFCDDQYKIGKTIESEMEHTIKTSDLYNKLKYNMDIKCLYGPMFNRIPSSDWYIQPDFTESIIQNINKGIGLINYIGHGTSEFLADEDILTYTDIDLIAIENNKLPIWIVGTCSFGNYINEKCFAEKILNKGNAGIAIISTTGNLSYESTYYFIEKISDKLKETLDEENQFKTLGQLFYDSIQELSLSYNKASLHLFGDPALKLNLSKKSSNIISNPINSISIGAENNLVLDNNNLYTLKILNEDNISEVLYNNQNSSFSFTYNGETLFYGNNQNESDYDEYINFILPLDAYQFNNAILKVHKEENNTIEIINNLPLQFSNESNILNDNTGPLINIYQNNNLINSGSSIYSPYNLTIEFEDISPINVSNMFSHNIKLWIDDTYKILEGYVPTYNGGFINCYIDSSYITGSKHDLKVEAWDIFNNRGYVSYEINFINDNNLIYNVYNFPNPFEDKTFFTFGFKNSEPINAEIKIFTLSGIEIYSNSFYLKSNNEHFYKFSWDGKDNSNQTVPSGIYLYHLEIFKNNNSIHQGIYKIAKI
tara:strand:- start:71 stop:2152 length:2082 start_codon:yes stop_codon:yes gene_type:complete